jgi:hypothetical protein
MTSGEGPTTRPEMLFRLLWDGGYQPVGGVLESGPGQAILQFTPQTVRRLNEVLSRGAIDALMLVIEHAYRPGQPTVVDGWSARWLREHGMLKTTAEKAVVELERKGYIRSERPRGVRTPIGATKVGVVPGGILQDVEDVPGVLALNGKQWKTAVGDAAANAQVGAVSAGGRDGDEGVENVVSALRRDGLFGTVSVEGRDQRQGVDNSVSASPRDGDERSLQTAGTQRDNALVGAGSAEGRDGSSTPPTRRSEEEGSDLLPPVYGAGGALTRTDLHRFLRSAGLRAHLSTRRDVVALALAGTFVANRDGARAALAFFDRETDTTPEMDLAWFLIDLLLLDGEALIAADGSLSEHLRNKGCRVPRHTSDELITGLVATLTVSMDTQVRDWVRWIVGGLARTDWHASAALAGLLDGLAKTIRLPGAGDAAREPMRLTVAAEPGLPAPVAPPLASEIPEAAPAGGQQAPEHQSTGAQEQTDDAAAASTPVPVGSSAEEYLAELRLAVVGTAWEDDISFQTLLSNPGRQEFVLFRYRSRRTAEG